MCAEFVHCGKVLYMVLRRFTKLYIKFKSHIKAKNSFSRIRVAYAPPSPNTHTN